MMILNPPTFVEQNNDLVVHGTILGCSPLRSSNQCFNKKNIIDSRRRPGH
jgi:hypothetical protein